MDKVQKGVREFMLKFNQSIPASYKKLNLPTRKLRAALLLEETLETITKGLGLSVNLVYEDGDVTVNKENLKRTEVLFEEDGELDPIEFIDGLCDINYVSYGAACAAGIDLERFEEEVSRSNLSKLWTKEDLENNPVPENAYVEDLFDGTYRVKQKNGKIAKSPSFSPPNIAKILEDEAIRHRQEWDDIW